MYSHVVAFGGHRYWNIQHTGIFRHFLIFWDHVYLFFHCQRP